MIAQYQRPDRQLLVLRGHDFAHRPAFQRHSDLEWRHVRLAFVHPSAHIGIDGHVQVAHQSFARFGIGDFYRGEGEIVEGGFPLGTAGETDFTTGRWHGSSMRATYLAEHESMGVARRAILSENRAAEPRS